MRRFVPDSTGGGMPARRAMARWAWRLFRREWRQQVLVLCLITAAVAATVLAAAVVTNTPPPADAGFGTADHLVVLQGGPHLAADIAAVKARFGTVDVIKNESIATGLVGGVQLRAQDPHGPYGGPMLALVSGRYPKGASQVAMTQQLATSLGLRLGGVWHEGGRALRVVGIVEDPQDLLDNFALVAPGQLSSPAQVTILFDATPASLAGFTFPQGATPLAPQASSGISPQIVVLTVAVLGLIFVGLIVTASFTVLAQRRLRALAMVSSLGATDRDTRFVLLANGAAVGVVGALLGALVGLAVWIAYAPHLAVSAHHSVVWTDLPWWLVIAAMALAVLTAILAALRPARVVTRTPIVGALSGRPDPPRSVHRSALPGIGLLALGPVLLAFSGGWGGNSGKDLVLQVGGLLASIAGLLLLAPLVIAALGLIARRPPIAARIALRDLVRYRSRSGWALAATSLAVCVAMLVILLSTGRFADPIAPAGPDLAANQVVVYAPGYGPSTGDGGADPNAPGTPRPDVSALRPQISAIASALDSHDVLPLIGSDGVSLRAAGTREVSADLYVATPQLLRHFGIDPNAIRPNTLLITSRRGLSGVSGLSLAYGPPPSGVGSLGGSVLHTVHHPEIQTFSDLPTGTLAPNLLLTEHAVRQLGLSTGPVAWLIQTPGPLSVQQADRARQEAQSADMTIATRSSQPSLDQLRTYAVAGGILLALGVLAMTLGLIRGESAGELRTLTATGAGRAVRRQITAVTSGVLGLTGAVLGTGVAYLVTVAFFRSQLDERMGQTPALDLLLVLVGLPLIATVGGWLLAGREPSAIARRPME